MEENKDKKNDYSGKLQLKKTFNAGQIKQSFSHGRSRSVSVEVKRKRTLSSLKNEEDKVNQSVPSSDQSEESLAVSQVSKNDSKQQPKADLTKEEKKEVKDTSDEKKPVKKNFSRQFDSKPEQDEKILEKEKKIKAPKFVKSPKSFENRRQGKLTISQALNEDNEKVRSLAAVKRAREKAKLRTLTSVDLKDSPDLKEKKM